MANNPRPVRGTHDLLGEEMLRHRHVRETGRLISELYGYAEIATPIFEFTEVFQRSLGDSSDVVTKEMYTFTDRGGESLTLRPENTAAVARALISGGLLQSAPLKLFYQGPMFRYERPQKGRLRQFHQIGVEVIGASEPAADIEVIAIGKRLLDELGIGQSVQLQINSLGDPESRAAYRDALVDYLSAHQEKLSEDSRLRLQRNPLRILDSKNEGDREVIKNAPPLAPSLNQNSQAIFQAVQDGLANLGIAFEINQALVRGLDYYTHVAFEFVTDALGAQGAVMAGGRYDGLVKEIGGPDTPGVGWAAGVERLSLLLAETPKQKRPVAIIPIGDEATAEAARLAEDLRRHALHVEFAFRGKPAQRMKRADRANSRIALFLGPDELGGGTVKLRNLDSGEEEQIGRSKLLERLGE